MHVSVTPQLERYIHDKVQSGRYTSASEVVREALRLMETHEQLRSEPSISGRAVPSRRAQISDRLNQK